MSRACAHSPYSTEVNKLSFQHSTPPAPSNNISIDVASIRSCHCPSDRQKDADALPVPSWLVKSPPCRTRYLYIMPGMLPEKKATCPEQGSQERKGLLELGYPEYRYTNHKPRALAFLHSWNEGILMTAPVSFKGSLRDTQYFGSLQRTI